MSIILMGICLWMAIGLQAQDFRKDFQAVYQNYMDLTFYTKVVEVRSFPSKNATQPSYEDRGKIVKYDEWYYSAMAGQQTIFKGEQYLNVNTKDKRMVYHHRAGKGTNWIEQQARWLENIQTVDISYLGASGNIKRYAMKNADRTLHIVEVHLDMKRKVLTKLVYYYKQESQQSAFYKTIITYQTDAQRKPSSTWFDLDKYIRLDEDRATVQPAYQGYRLTQSAYYDEAIKRKFAE